jgi:peptide/nickel transport system permease protein
MMRGTAQRAQRKGLGQRRSDVGGYLIRRIIGLLPTVLFLLFLVVAMMELLPGDAVEQLLLERSNVDAESRKVLEESLGLDKSLPLRYLEYVGGIVRGDFGESLWTKKPVAEMVVNRLPATVEIGIISIVLGTIGGIILGTVSAVTHNKSPDVTLRLIATIGNSVPNFALATGFVVLPAIWFGTTLNLRYRSLAEDPIAHLQIIAVPVFLLTYGHATGMLRLVRTQMLEVLRQDYVRTARAKGLQENRVIMGHALKNALIPVVTVLGLQIATLLSGSVITETIFAIPGVGRLLTASIQTQDFPVVQGIVVMVGLFVIVTNLIVDLSYAWLDPRIKFE